jgi:predicted amidohydrolase YtcJ
LKILGKSVGRSCMAIALALSAGCRGTSVRTSAEEGAPPRAAGATLFHHGRIYLGAPEWRAVDALLVREGRVAAAGSESELAGQLDSSVERVDLGGATVVPGLEDAHGHIEGLGRSLESVDLRGCASYGELIERVAARAAGEPAGTWIVGRGWDQNLWPEKRFPEHAALSARTPNHPVFLSRVDGHAALVNRRALELAGYTGPQPTDEPVAGGRLLLDEKREPTGVAIDNGISLLSRAIPPAEETARARRILLAQEHLLALGLTCVHDMGVDLEMLGILRRLAAEGRLALRVVVYLDAESLRRVEELRSTLSGFEPLPQLSIAGVKLYADGALGSRGAALLEDYSDDPGNRGLLVTSEADLREAIARAASLSLQPAIHAIGDRGNRIVLDLYAERERIDPAFRELRPRIEHAQVVAPEDWARFAELGVVPSMQPTHATSDMRWAVDRLGPSRTAGAYAWRRLAPDLGALAFGSDFPVESANPMLGLYAAITRQDASGWPEGGFLPDQRVDAKTALAGFTAGAARAARQEAVRGSLRPGCAADFTALDVDPLTSDPRALLTAHARMVAIDGRIVWRAEGP